MDQREIGKGPLALLYRLPPRLTTAGPPGIGARAYIRPAGHGIMARRVALYDGLPSPSNSSVPELNRRAGKPIVQISERVPRPLKTPMKTKATLVAIVVLVFVGSHLAKESLDGSTGPVAPPAPEDCRRIVSMAPSVTETLFALGLGDRVVGVTRYCKYPPEADEKDEVGGHFDPNFEAIVALRPDLVILLVEQEESRQALNSLGIATLVVRHKDIEGVLESISTIGRVCGAEETAGQLLADIAGRMEKIRRRS
ncbi:MAG: ABC transporter substrate-binding protein, partial [Planctomycetes bacterium]|nr:ABC transporter substrate-binding protein [Planctomycetota bacterium]